MPTTMIRILGLLLLFGGLQVQPAPAQTVPIPYSGSAPYSGSMTVQVQIKGLPAGCTIGGLTFANNVINGTASGGACGATPPPTNCAAQSTPAQGCGIGSTVAVVNQPGNVRGTPGPGGTNGSLLGTQNAGATGVIVTNPQPQAAPSTAGWQLVNFGAPSCTTAGPFTPGSNLCGYVGNDNLKPATTPPPVPPTITCSPASVQTGGTVNCSGNQAIASWKTSAGTISGSGVLTAPATAQTVTVTGTNANGSGTFPVAVTSTSACSQTMTPSGGVDNGTLLSKLKAAGPTGCVELLIGSGPYHWTPFTNTTGNVIVDDATTHVDSGIFPRTTPLFSLGSDGFSIQGKGPLFNSQWSMPTNYANAQKENNSGCGTDACDYEYQHCFALRDGVSRITITGIVLKGCAGDGVDMDDTTESISINVDSSGNIRQGISCTGAVNGVILAGWAHDGPLTGFDCEPDSGISGDIQIVVNGLKTSGNKGGGRSYGFMNLTPATKVNVVDNNPVSTSDIGMGIAFWNRNSGVNANATGSITINGFNVNGATTNCTGGAKSTDGFTVKFNGGTCTNTGQAALMVKVDGGETGTPGGVSWSGISIVGTAPALSLSNAAQTTVSNSTYNGKAVSYP